MPRPKPLRSRNADALDLAEILRDLAEFVFLDGADVRGTCQALFGSYIYELASRSRLNDRPLSGLLRAPAPGQCFEFSSVRHIFREESVDLCTSLLELEVP